MQLDLTVLIPNFNCRTYLPLCLDSVLEQLPANAEVLVVDDGSTDGSQEWLLEKAAVCKQLNVVFQDNQGVVKARNTGIMKARGKWVAFLDADDFWYPNKINSQLDVMKANHDCVLSFTNYDHLTEAYTSIIDCFDYWKEVALKQTPFNQYYFINDPLNTILATNLIGTSTVVVKKQAIIETGLFNPNLNSASDWEMWLRLAAVGGVAYSSTPLMGYLMREGSITSNRINRLQAMSSIIEQVSDYNGVKQSAVKAAEAKVSEGYADYYRENQCFRRAVYHDVNSLLNAPHLRSIKHLCFDIWNLFRPRDVALWKS